MGIAILLATYNSEKYLRVQLDSLLAQKFEDFKIYIRDDGSRDSTLSIIDHCIEENPDKVELLQDSFKGGRGAKGSFMWLLEVIDADYYMFCDHDDYWLSNKVDLTFGEMKKCEAQNPNKAIIVNTDLEVVDADLNVIAPSFWEFSKINRPLLSDFNYLSVYNGFTGCTMMLNQKAKELSLPISDVALMHDIWIALKVSSNGGVLGYVNQATIKYRQHGNNVVGAIEVGGVRYLIAKIKSLGLVIRRNRQNLEMVQSIKRMSIFMYLYYKLLYYIKR